ncbi:MAG: hypothetical protein CBC95_002505 [Crocinitomicaceae bacterium TMED135]|nr:MAG: hypothetical protein CBC95_002505 [Crocinitomicaceae bacterium TMED135]|tara:strand:+ start:2007 stop:2402 length:396 start_codon:yes stop_codon:yes gene_type:complete
MQKRTYYILFASIFFFLSSNKVISQYRDPFSEKRKRPSIKKNNNMGLLHAKTFFKRQNDSFTNYKRQNGVIGIDNDPFKITGKNKFKPTGIEEDSFTSKQRNLAITNKYNKSLVKKKALKSRRKYQKHKMK